MQFENISATKRSVDALHTAFSDALSKENDSVQTISDILYDMVNHLTVACEFYSMMSICSNEVDIEEFKYKINCANDDALECIESILDIMRSNTMCIRLKMALTGSMFIIRSELASSL